MSLAGFALAEPAIAQNETPTVRKPPPKRQAVAMADSPLVPEPR